MLRGAFDLVLTSCSGVLAETAAVTPLLEIGVEQFVGVHFRRVTGKIEYLDLACVLLEPLLDSLGAMRAQVDENEEYLLRLVVDQAVEEIDRDAGVRCAEEDSPPHLALVGHNKIGKLIVNSRTD